VSIVICEGPVIGMGVIALSKHVPSSARADKVGVSTISLPNGASSSTRVVSKDTSITFNGFPDNSAPDGLVPLMGDPASIGGINGATIKMIQRIERIKPLTGFAIADAIELIIKYPTTATAKTTSVIIVFSTLDCTSELTFASASILDCCHMGVASK